MGIEAIDSKYGYGDTISSKNALQIYKDRECYNDLRPSQQKYVQKFLTQEQKDQVDYDMKSTDAKNNGKDKINTEGTEGGRGVGSAGAFVGSASAISGTLIAAITGKMKKNADTAKGDGFKSVLGAALTLAGAAVALVLSFPNMFDASYNDRKARSKESDATNEVIQSHNDALVESMDMMDESLETYQGQVEDFTDTTNANNSRATELEIEIADAEAMGDADKVKSLKEELTNLNKFDYSGMEDDMKSTRDELDEYGLMAQESEGVKEAGSSVADFLKVGNSLSTVAYINAGLLTASALILGIAAIVGAIPKIGPLFPDTGPAITAGILWVTSALMIGVAATMMFSNAGKESEFGSNGDTMADNVDALNKTIEDHIAYTETTTEDFNKADEDSQESIAENNEKSAEAKEQADKTRKPVQKDESGEGEEQTESIIS